MTGSLKKNVYRWAGIALVPIAIAVAGFFFLLLINPDCDGFACLGYFMVLLPFFLFGVTVLVIVLVTVLVIKLYRGVIKKAM